MKAEYGKIYWWILGLAALLFIPFIGNAHLFDWDELNFAECAREMIVSGNYFQPQINFQPFWEKPPLYIWMQVLSMKAFGINEFAARFPNTIAGLLTLFTLMRVGSKMTEQPLAGKYWALAFLGSILPHLYFRSGIIDPWFNYFIFLGILYYGYAFAKTKSVSKLKHKPWVYALLSGFFIGLGILTKGPVAYLIPLLVIGIEWMVRGFKDFRTLFKHVTLMSMTALVTTLIWFGPDIMMHGTWFLKTFVTYQIRLFSTPDAGHGGFWGYHVVVLLFGVFPASFLAIRGLIFRKEIKKRNDTYIFNRLMSVTFWVVLVLFTIVKSKIVHYSSLAYFPITYYAGMAIAKELKTRTEIPLRPKRFILFFGIIFGLLFAFVPILGQHIHWLKPYLNDSFAQAKLSANVQWQRWNILVGLWLIALSIWWFLTEKRKPKLAYSGIFIGMGIFVWLTLSVFINKIEGYSQGSIIEFYKSKEKEDCYLYPWAYKSYAHLFYGKVKPHTNPKAYEWHWFLIGAVDKPTYIIIKNTSLKSVREHTNAPIIYEKDGFIVLKRTPKNED